MNILDEEQQEVLKYLLRYSKGNALNRQAAEVIENLASRLQVAEEHLGSIGAGGVSKMQ